MSPPTDEQRHDAIARLLWHLCAGPRPLLTPAEHLRAASFVPGWTVKQSGRGLWEVNGPSIPTQELARDELIPLLRVLWAPAAKAEVGQ